MTIDSAHVREPEIAFQAGSHMETIAMKPSDYLEARGAEIAALASEGPAVKHRSGLLVEVPL